MATLVDPVSQIAMENKIRGGYHFDMDRSQKTRKKRSKDDFTISQRKTKPAKFIRSLSHEVSRDTARSLLGSSHIGQNLSDRINRLIYDTTQLIVT